MAKGQQAGCLSANSENTSFVRLEVLNPMSKDWALADIVCKYVSLKRRLIEIILLQEYFVTESLFHSWEKGLKELCKNRAAVKLSVFPTHPTLDTVLY